MATNHHNLHLPPTNPRKVCFSFAAYAKTVIAALKSSDVHVSAGLTDVEITAIETAGGFTFPPDLRSILSEGLPVGPGFPNWRSSSRHQLRLLTSLPILSLSKEVSRNNFWVPSWGPRPNNKDEAHSLAQKFLAKAPPLVPVFRNCYIPAEPKLAGNPVFYVHGGDVRLLSADVGGFFKETAFWRKDCVRRRRRNADNVAPAWVEEARRVEFWTDAAAREVTCRRWWSEELSSCIEEVMWRLRDGGWTEEDVRDMMMMNGGDESVTSTCVSGVRSEKEGDVKHVRKLSRELLKSSWSVDDLVYTFSEWGDVEGEGGILDGEAWLEVQCGSIISCN
ncbi:Endoribonuclease YbeY [Bienertia sinuspersici]